MNRDELAKAMRTAAEQSSGYCPASEIDWDATADAALAYFREYLGRDETVEAMAKAHCDHFGGEGWWETGLLRDTLPEAHKAMRAAVAAIGERHAPDRS